MPFTRVFHVRWGDMDFNAHMKNTAYLDLCGDVRLMYYAERGFPASEFARLKVGPVMMRDEIEYFKEMHLLEPLTVTYTLAGLSADGSRFRFRNEFFRADGKLVARVTSTGGWLDLTTRKLTAPPASLAAVIRDLERTDDYAELPASARPA